MSNLQIGLAVAGGVVLAAVVAHGAWSARRLAPRQPRISDDALVNTEPAMLDESAPDQFEALSRAVVTPERRAPLDALIDVIAPLMPEATVSGDAVLAAMPATRRLGSKPFAIEGFNESAQQWEPAQPGGRYASLQAGVQLANRSGALNDIEFSEFVVQTQHFADLIGASAQFPDMLEEVARARELDQFACTHDAQLSFTLRASQASWSPGYVQQCAATLGFVAGALPGRLVMPASVVGLPPVLVLSFDTQAALAEEPAQSALREVTLDLDVAQVDRSERAFVRMREAAKTLARLMDGVVTDDLGHSLASDSMDLIGSELEQLYDALDARDLSAGSLLARRLFS